MPHNNSAAKRLRQNNTRRLANKARLTELNTLVKNIRRSIHDGKKADAEATYRDLAKHADQAASRNTIHPNRASRLKARLALAIGGIGTASTAAPVRAANKAPAKPKKKA